MNYEFQSFRNDFNQIVIDQAEKIAIVDGNTEAELTYSELDCQLRHVESSLANCGLSPGSTLVSILPNSAEALLVFLAAARMGLNFAPFSTLSSSFECNEWAKFVKSDLVLVSDAVSPELLELLNTSKLNYISISQIMNKQGNVGPIYRDSEPCVGRLYIQTSGTTGASKVITIELDRLWSSACAWVKVHSDILNSEVRFMNYLSVAYLGGLFNLCLIPIAARGSIVVTQAFSGSSLLNFWSDIDRFEINALWLVPSILRGLLVMNDRTRGKHRKSHKRIKFAFIGTATIDQTTKEKGEREFGFRLLENYALSETTFITTEAITEEPQTERGVGHILPYVEVRIKPEEDNTDIGELLVRTPFLAIGYLQADGTNVSGLDANGYFATGDIGRVAKSGELFLAGRIKEIVKKGGYLVWLGEVEAVALRHPSVQNAAAISVPHEFYGEDIALFVKFQCQDDSVNLITNLRNWITTYLARYKWPGQIYQVDSLPLTASGKIQRHKIQLPPTNHKS